MTAGNPPSRGRLVTALVGAAWLGAVAFFAGVVAPAAFEVLPQRATAGALVRRVLPPLFFGGMLAGLVPAVVDRRVTRATAAGLIATTCCAIAQLVVGERIERLRLTIGGSLDALAAADPRRLAFARLHLASVALLGAAALCFVIVVADGVRTARAGSRGRRSLVEGNS